MKKLIVFFACLALCLPFAFSSQEEEYYSHSYARLNYVKGDVYIQRANDLGYEEGVVNLPIVEGDKLGTRDGRAEIHFGHKNYLRINLNSQIDFVRLPREGDDLIDFHLLEGSVYLRVKLLQTEKGIEVHTPDASFYVLNEGLYRIEVSPDNETKLYVIEGEMEAAGEEGSIAVARGEYLMAQEGRFQLMNSNEEDYRGGESFSDWNRSREEFYGRSVYRNYLPNELYEYETELAYYGRWMYERPYGYVWVPNVHTSSWRPYYNGRWAWYPVIGWTWVSYEPWGWAVSHYGRWHWRGGMGWYWIPQHHWGPAWVHWYHGSDYIGWSPLSYWNRPGVILNNRFYGRYSTGHYPMNSWALTVVRKNQLQARHISKAALGRNSVSRLGKMSLSAKQPGQRYVVNGDRALAGKAKGALNRSSARTVSKGFVSSRALKSSVGRSGTGSRSPSRALSRDGNVSRSSSSRAIKKPSSSTVSRSRSSSSSRSSANSSPARSSSSSKSRTVKRYQSPSSNRAASKSRSTSSSSRSTVTRAKSSTSSSARVSKARSSSSSSTKSSGSKATKSRSTTKTKKKESRPASSYTAQSTVKRYSSGEVSPRRSSSTSSRGVSRSTPTRSARSSSPQTYSRSSRSSRSSVSSSRARSSSPSRVTRSPSRSSSPARVSSRTSSRSSSRGVSRSSPARSTRSSSPRSVSRSSSSRSSSSASRARSSSSSRSSSGKTRKK